MDFYIKLLLNNLLLFLAGTIKNPQSVAKFKAIFITIHEALGTLITALGGTGEGQLSARASKLSRAERDEISAKLSEASQSLFVN